MKELAEYELVMNRANSCADRWVKAWGMRSGYIGADDVRIDIENQVITFKARPSCSGLRPPCSISIKYLDDDSSLEADSLKSYTDDYNARVAKSERVNELRQSDAVLELGRLGYVMEPYQPRFIL